MRRHDVINRLRYTEATLRALGVESLYLFGSHARDEAQPGSDIDVFIDPGADKVFGFLPFMKVHEVLEQAVGAKVDYGTRRGLHPLIRDDVEREAVRVF